MGYKLYLVVGEHVRVHAWKVESMNVAEQVVAEELIPATARSAGPDRWLLGDKQYDSNRLHDLTDACGLRLLTQRMRTKDAIGPKQSPGRRRAIELLEVPGTPEGRQLFARRGAVERYLGTLLHRRGPPAVAGVRAGPPQRPALGQRETPASHSPPRPASRPYCLNMQNPA